jgi:hypothetical protein
LILAEATIGAALFANNSILAARIRLAAGSVPRHAIA